MLPHLTLCACVSARKHILTKLCHRSCMCTHSFLLGLHQPTRASRHADDYLSPTQAGLHNTQMYIFIKDKSGGPCNVLACQNDTVTLPCTLLCRYMPHTAVHIIPFGILAWLTGHQCCQDVLHCAAQLQQDTCLGEPKQQLPYMAEQPFDELQELSAKVCMGAQPSDENHTCAMNPFFATSN